MLTAAVSVLLLPPPLLLLLLFVKICTNHNVKRVQRQPHLFWRLLADKLVEMPPSPQKAALLQRYMPFIQQTLNKALLAVMCVENDVAEVGENLCAFGKCH